MLPVGYGIYFWNREENKIYLMIGIFLGLSGFILNTVDLIVHFFHFARWVRVLSDESFNIILPIIIVVGTLTLLASIRKLKKLK